MLSTMCIESSPLDVNSTTILLELLFQSTNYILEVVKLNTIHVFKTPHKRHRTNTSGLVSSPKSQTATFSRDCTLYLDGKLNELLSHENQPCPPSLSVRGKLKLGTKSDNVRCLEDAQRCKMTSALTLLC